MCDEGDTRGLNVDSLFEALPPLLPLPLVLDDISRLGLSQQTTIGWGTETTENHFLGVLDI